MGCRESDSERLLAELGRAYAKALLAGDEIARSWSSATRSTRA